MAGLNAIKTFIKKLLVNSIVGFKQQMYVSQLVEIGRFSKPKIQNDFYETGQLFINKVFAYRGIIIYPWSVKVYDTDLSVESLEERSNQEIVGQEKKLKVPVEYYYQAFIDARDRSLVNTQIDYINFGGDIMDPKTGLYSVPGLDIVAHEDILPFSVAGKVPFQHELINTFFIYRPTKGSLNTVCKPSFVAKNKVYDWYVNNWGNLKLSEVHKKTTEGIRTTVVPYFMGCQKTETIDIYAWRYNIRFHNLRESPVTFKTHSWRVFGHSGIIETVDGVGIMGQELTLDKATPVFQYTGHVSSQKPYSHISGLFKTIKEDGSSFDCHVPSFFLKI